MGTSVSHRSPRTVSWAAVSAAYRASNVGIDRVVAELWRAARSEPSSNWESLLAGPAVTICLRSALANAGPEGALRAASRQISQELVSSLAADIAKRAVVKSFSHEDKASGFARELLVEASNYLVARDLSGAISPNSRNTTVSQAIAFKERISQRVSAAVHDAGSPSSESAAWTDFLHRAIERLVG